MIRARAAEYGVKPDKIVMVDFSAGAIVTGLTALHQDPSARPNYAAPIYGGPLGGVPDVPQGLPPFFLAVAQDGFFWWMETNGLTRKPGDPERPNRATSPNRGRGDRHD